MRASTAMAPQLLGRLIGLILGDGYIGRTRPTWNAIFPFQLSLKRFPYFWQVFSLLCHFCQSFAWYAKEQPYIPRGFSPYHDKIQSTANSEKRIISLRKPINHSKKPR